MVSSALSFILKQSSSSCHAFKGQSLFRKSNLLYTKLLPSVCQLSTTAVRDAKFYDCSKDAVKDIPDGAKLLVGGKMKNN